MTPAASYLLAAAAAAAAADWLAVGRGARRVEFICKPAALVFLIGVAVALEPSQHSQRGWFVAALAFGLAGDVFLMLRSVPFVAGLLSFFAGHVAYIVGFRLEPASGAALAAGAVILLPVAAAISIPIVRSVSARQRGLAFPVAAYAAVLAAMALSAAGTGEVPAALGGGLFLLSDGLLAWNRFVKELGWAPLAIIVAYHLGQAALVLSLIG